MARYFIVTGESSGDKLGGLLSEKLIGQGHLVSGWGGIYMQNAGVSICENISKLKVMGFSDVIMILPKLSRLLSKCKKDIETFNPDAILLVDFGTFNLRIAKWAYAHHIRVIYYSPPKIWATRQKRINLLKKYCQKIIVLFPFEKEYYLSKGLDVDYYGHPFANIIRQYVPDKAFRLTYRLDARPILAILPGSRRSEILNTLPIYLKSAEIVSQFQICVSAAEGMVDDIREICSNTSLDLKIIEDGYYDLLHHAAFALVTSGTATMETSLFAVPQIVGYKTSWLNYFIAKSIIKTQFIALPNLIAGELVVPELIQTALNPSEIKKNIIRICRVDSKSKLDISYNGIINAMYIEKCLFNTIAAISNDQA